MVDASRELLAWAISTFQQRFAVVTSFQKEGMVILDMAARISPQIHVLTLDTGRLPAETFDMIEMVRGRYGLQVEMVSPAAPEIESMVTRHGPNLFYEAVSHRTLCCHFRKYGHWNVSWPSLMPTQSVCAVSKTRAEARTPGAEPNGRVKLSPLAGWSREDVAAYIKRYDVPMHPLYAKGYTSIGCEPCSRATEAGEDERAGR
ncbi:MAG: phosphoadenosine phosphosulfate reductase family protein [Bryobacteraceae bacterium]